jgi:GxxExxY protein
MNTDYRHGELTEQIIGAAYEVYNALGRGFLEKVYENALALELSRRGLQVQAQQPIEVRHRGEVVGQYFADLVVEGEVIVEAKSVASLDGAHEAQLINYLKATGIGVGLLINFGPEIEIKRRVF